MDWRFAVQVIVSLIAMGFGIAVFFSQGSETIGTGIVTTVLGLWMRGGKYKDRTQRTDLPI